MASVALPTCPLPNAMQMFLKDFGGDLTPFLGGPVQRINRIGTRLGARFTMPEMEQDEAMAYVSRLMRGKQLGVIVPWVRTDFDPGNPGTPLIASSSSGTALALKGLSSGYTIVEGQFLSIIRASRRYLHVATGDVTATSGGLATVSVFPSTRVTFATDDIVELEEPMIEGTLLPGEELSWQTALELDTAITFTVVESR